MDLNAVKITEKPFAGTIKESDSLLFVQKSSDGNKYLMQIIFSNLINQLSGIINAGEFTGVDNLVKYGFEQGKRYLCSFQASLSSLIGTNGLFICAFNANANELYYYGGGTYCSGTINLTTGKVVDAKKMLAKDSVDSSLDSESENPVQNKVVASVISNILNTLSTIPEFEKTENILNRTITTESGQKRVSLESGAIDLVEGELYSVEINGNLYECVATHSDTAGFILTNGGVVGASDEDFFAVQIPTNSTTPLITFSTAGSYKMMIYISTYQKLPYRYLPTDHVVLTDRVTGKDYNLYIADGKLTLEESEV